MPGFAGWRAGGGNDGKILPRRRLGKLGELFCASDLAAKFTYQTGNVDTCPGRYVCLRQYRLNALQRAPGCLVAAGGFMASIQAIEGPSAAGHRIDRRRRSLPLKESLMRRAGIVPRCPRRRLP